MKLHVTNTSVMDLVCSKHFTKEDYIQLVLNDFKSCSVASTSIDGSLCVHGLSNMPRACIYLMCYVLNDYQKN